MQEEWISIPSYEGYYEVSNLGRVKSVARIKSANRGGKYFKPEKILANAVDNSGYVRLLLAKEGVKKKLKLSRLVALCFIPNPENKPYVNHIDCNKLNDTYTNLEWCTQVENVKHAYENHLRSSNKGKRHAYHFSHEKAKEVREIYKLKQLNQREIAEKYQVSIATINGIINNKIWKVPENYNNDNTTKESINKEETSYA